LPEINSIQEEIRARLAEVEHLIAPLQVEADQLSKLIAAFDATPAPTAPPVAAPRPARSRTRTARKTTSRTPRPASTSSAKRGRPKGGGNRAAQAVVQITKQPGMTAAQLAAAMGIGPNYLYRVLPQLQREGKITKQGKGYHAAGDTVAITPAANGQGVTA
jgi:hypothetical protein